MARGLSLGLFLSALVALAPVASAQSVDPAQPPACEHGHGHGHGERIEHMIRALGLDATQAAAVRQIVSETQPERARIHAMPRGSAEQIAARHQLEQQTHARIDAVLTDAQRAQLAQLRERRGEGHGGWHGRGHHGGRGAPPPAGI